MDYKLIAPCGMNCGICRAHLRLNNPCSGCNYPDENKPKTITQCKLLLCDKRKDKYCFSCTEFPCDRLKHLDKQKQRGQALNRESA